MVPSLSVKDNVTQLDVILEAIRYIASLRSQLERKKNEEEEKEEEKEERKSHKNQRKVLPRSCQV